MTFLIIKVFSTLLYPIFSSIVAIGGGLALKRFRKNTGYALILGGLSYLYLCSTNQFAAWLAGTIEDGYEYVDVSQIHEADAIVVQGGGVWHSRGGALQLNDPADRVLYGARLIKANKAPYIFVSAGTGHGQRPSSEAMAEFLIELGIPQEKIIEENQAQNTYEHTVYLESMFKEREIDSIILVTSSWHMRRSLAVFESNLNHIEIVPFPVDSERGRYRNLMDYVPRVEALSKSTKIIKEYIGYVIYDVRGWID